MIYSKSNLQVVNVTSKDKDINVLSHVHFNKDGSTAGIDGRAIMIVEPSPEEYRKHFIVENIDNSGFNIPATGVKEALKNIPSDSKFKGLLEQISVSKETETDVELTTTDGQQIKKIQVRKHRKPFPDVKNLLKESYSQNSVKICLNRSRLIKLLTAIDKACPDSSGENAIFIEVSNEGVLMRAQNMKTGQIAIGLMSQYEGTWLKKSKWEKEVIENDS